ncbi:MAG: hypothetical protein J6N52_12845 [Clostridia bacterium]|nr:hypothetical protein [Clostridia bacterium]
MKKRILNALLILSMSTAFGAAAHAETIPEITWGEREIYIDNPQAEFSNGVFMVPVRRLCQLAGASVDWYESNQGIIINSKDNLTRLFLYIGNDTLRIFKFTSIADGVGENVPLEAPLKIIDGRTLVPFEQICRALNLNYEWSGDRTSIAVEPLTKIGEDKRVEVSISTDKEEVSEGDEVTITVTASNMDIYPGTGYSGYTAGILYNPEEFQLVSSCLTTSEGEKSEGGIGADNGALTKDSLKVAYVTVDIYDYIDNKAPVGKIVLKALTDNGGTVSLSDRIGNVGYDTSIVLTDKESKKIVGLQKDTELKIDTTPIVIK